MSKKSLLERAEREQAEIDRRKAAHEAEIQRLANATDARLKAEAAERKRQDDEAQVKREVEVEAELETEVRSLFFNAAPGASEALYQASREEFRRLVLRRRAEAAADAPRHSLYRWDA